jgi:hypothetical protein
MGVVEPEPTRSTHQRIKEVQSAAVERRLDFLFTGGFVSEVTELMGLDRIKWPWPTFANYRRRPYDQEWDAGITEKEDG